MFLNETTGRRSVVGVSVSRFATGARAPVSSFSSESYRRHIERVPRAILVSVWDYWVFMRRCIVRTGLLLHGIQSACRQEYLRSFGGRARRDAMAQSTTLVDRIVGVVAGHPGCCLDEVAMYCSDLTWNQIFLEVDRLSRSGVMKLALAGPGRYTVTLPTERNLRSSQSKTPPLPIRSRQDTQCKRCDGLMVSEDDTDFNGWRCILCGERIDPVILAQRWKSEVTSRQTVHASP